MLIACRMVPIELNYLLWLLGNSRVLQGYLKEGMYSKDLYIYDTPNVRSYFWSHAPILAHELDLKDRERRREAPYLFTRRIRGFSITIAFLLLLAENENQPTP
ncbi:hypothetical protein VNO77_31643 [Canavalia gladiata]|uniref:Uncharacterized protein n=1 Tax=Canavalia gladiata TaxID=3824 RepID=A0AAN9KPT8_CANGL